MLATLISVSVTPGAPDLSLAHCVLGTVSGCAPPPPDEPDEPPLPVDGPVAATLLDELAGPVVVPFVDDCVPFELDVPLELDVRASSEFKTLVGRREPQDEPMKIAIKHNETSRARKLPLP